MRFLRRKLCQERDRTLRDQPRHSSIADDRGIHLTAQTMHHLTLNDAGVCTIHFATIVTHRGSLYGLYIKDALMASKL